MGRVAALKLFDLLFGLFDGDGHRIVDEQREDLHLVDFRKPEFAGEFRVSAHCFRKFAQFCQSDAVARQLAGLFFNGSECRFRHTGIAGQLRHG